MAGSMFSFSSAFSNSGLTAAGKCCLDHSKSFALGAFSSSTRRNCMFLVMVISAVQFRVFT